MGPRLSSLCTAAALGLVSLAGPAAGHQAPSLEVSQADALVVDADGSLDVSPGDLLRYTVALRNAGPDRATGVLFHAAPGRGTALVAGSVTTSQGSVVLGDGGSDTTVTVALGELRKGATATVAYEVALAPRLPFGLTRIVNQGMVTAHQVVAVLSDDPDTAETADPTVTLVGSGPALVALETAVIVDAELDEALDEATGKHRSSGRGFLPEDRLRYTVTLVNRGGSPATGVVFTDTPRPPLRLVSGSVTTSQGTVVAGNGAADTSVAVELGELAAADSATVTFEAKVDPAIADDVAVVANAGVVSSAEHPAGIATDDPRTVEVADPTVTPRKNRARLGATKTDLLLFDANGDGRPGPGDLLRYVVSLHYRGDAQLREVLFLDSPGAGSRLVAGSVRSSAGHVRRGNAQGDVTVEVELGTLKKEKGATVVFDVAVASPLPSGAGSVANQGFATAHQLAPVPTDDPSTPAAGDPTVTALAVPAALGDFVWEDRDGDGVQEDGEPGVSGVTVTLLDAGGALLATTATGGDGRYRFADLDADRYVVVVTAPPGFTFSPRDQGGDDARDSDMEPASGHTALLDLAAGAVELSVDAGLLRGQADGAVAGFVWSDLDGDGIQDPDEAGIPSVAVRLFDGAGSPLAGATTDAGGRYRFADLAAGSYAVGFTAPGGFTASPQDQGGDDARDSDASPVTGRTAVVQLAAGGRLEGVDAGFYQPAALGDFVWHDLDGNGIQDAGEPGIGGADLTLLGGAGQAVAATTSNADGSYLFSGVVPGTYVVAVTAPPGYLFGPLDQGSNDDIDSDLDPATGRSGPRALPAGSTTQNVDVGLYRTVAIGDFVWKDVNNDGIQNPGEPGLEGVTVKLLDANTIELRTAQTDSSGHYQFSALPPGRYIVELVPPPSFALTTPDVGDDLEDSDLGPASHRTEAFQVTSGVTLTSVDAGLFNPPAQMTSSPMSGETDVAVTRETILRFSNPLADSAVVDDSVVFAEFAGGRLPARIHVAPDRRAVTLFYNQDLPPSARVRVRVVGEALLDVFGNPVDADGDGVAGGVGEIDFETLALTTMDGTAVCGRVFASELAPGDPGTSVNVPLEGVIVSVDGAAATLRAVTDAQGNFCLDPAPLGSFFVHIDGRAATNPLPPGDYYPFVGKEWQSVAGRTVNIGEVYLPRVVAGTLQPVSRTSETVVTFPPAVLAQFPGFEGTEIAIPADALYSDDGSRGGMAGIAPVPPDRLPGPPPAGLEFPLVITVQTDGPTNFDQPVPICFPNLPDPGLGEPLAPGTKNALYSFNHDTGEWEHIGPMTVTGDGRLICTDAGVGILAPGWHGSGPPPTQPPPPPQPPQRKCPPIPGGPPCSAYYNSRLAECEADHIVHEAAAATEQGTLLVECVAGTLVLGPWAPLGSLGCAVAIGAQSLVLDKLLDKLEKKCEDDALKEFDECLDFYFNCSILVKERPAASFVEQLIRGRADPPTAASRIAVSEDPASDPVVQLIRQFEATVAPYNRPGTQLPPEAIAQVRGIVAEAQAITGGNAPGYLRDLTRRLEVGMPPIDAPTVPAAGNAPPYPILYSAMVRAPSGILMLRGQTAPLGQYTLFIGRNASLQAVNFYDPRTKSFGREYPRATPNLRYKIGRVTLVPVDPSLPDSDQDGVNDGVEEVYGTDHLNPDSDNDGVLDGPEIDQGTNPLDGRPAQTGVIATADTPGTAVDVCAVNDVAVVADGPSGVSVFNVFAGMNPILIARVDTPGSAQAVACAGGRIAVADGSSGLAVVAISDRSAARLTHRVDLGAPVVTVAAAGDIGYAGTSSGQLWAVDLATGAVLDQTLLASPVEDLAVAGDHLYALTSASLHVFDTLAGGLRALGSVPVGGSGAPLEVGRKLFVGGGIAHVGHFIGQTTVDVGDPAHPRVLAVPPSTQLAVHDIAANGSGLVVIVSSFSGPSTLAVSLYDASDPRDVTRFLTSIDTPGDARALSIYNGLAYVADSQAGLQVVNYLAYDAQGQAPTIALSTSFDGSEAEEGQLARLTALVTDDVQVRNVEFFLDGTRVLTDGNFPFEHRFVVPLLSAQPTFTVRACATDTGGNRTCSDETTVSVVEDRTPPALKATSPRADAQVVAPTAVTATFTEPIEVATLDASGFRLFAAGPDGVPGTADDVPVAATLGYRDELNTAVLSLAAPLGLGGYRAVVGPGIADRKGNVTAAEAVWTFQVKPPPTVSITSPAPGSSHVVGTFVFVQAIASDPVGIASITLTADGVPFFTSAFSSAGTSFQVPTGRPTVTFGANALDRQGNIGTATPVTVTVTPDPAPTVTLTAPPEGTTVTEGATLTMAATATDNVRVVNVRFFADDVLRATDTTAPYETSFPVPVGGPTLRLRAEATDDLDQVGVSPVRELTRLPDDPPTVALTAPPSGTSLVEGAAVLAQATASDNERVAQVRFAVDGSTVGTDTSAPYAATFTVPLDKTSIEVAAEATDNLGKTATDSDTFTILPDPPPTVTLTTPAEGQILFERSLITLEADAADNVAVAKCRFYVNGELVAEDATAPYRAAFTVPAGVTSLRVEAEAEDNLGRTQRTGRDVAVVPDPPPTVALTAPPEGTSLTEGDSVLFQATATDNVRVAQVRFVIGGQQSVDFTDPFEARVSVPFGISTLSVSVEAMDNLGQTSTATLAAFPVLVQAARLFVEPQTLSFFLPAKPAGLTSRADRPGHGSLSAGRSSSSASAPAEPRPASGVVGGLPATGAPPVEPIRLPLYFEPQAEGGSGFVVRGHGYAMALGPSGMTLAAVAAAADRARAPLGLSFAGANPHPRIVGLELQPGVSHYLRGGSPSKWRRNVPHYGRLRYEDVYPGVDFVFYGRERELEYDIVLEPGADPRAVALAVAGVDGLQIDANGDLVLSAGGAELRQLKPVVYQEDAAGGRRLVDARYVLQGANRIGFDVEGYDRGRPLVIDPVLRFSSYLGGSGVDSATSIELDAAGYIYIAGSTTSADFPVKNPLQGISGYSFDAFLTKVTPDGSSVVYSTYLGGSGSDLVNEIDVDADGNVYLTGSTTSTDFPTQNAFQTTGGLCGGYCTDAFVSALDASGASFVFSTYLGGSNNDSAGGIALDAAGNVRVAGWTRSDAFPGTAIAFHSVYDRADIFVSTFTSAGAFVGTRAFGTSYAEGATDVAVDSTGALYVAGFYNSGGAPPSSPGLFGPYSGGCGDFFTLVCGDVFVMKLDASGSPLYTFYLGGDGDDISRAVVVDADGNAYVGGSTSSASLGLTNPIQTTGAGFLAKLGATGSPVYSTRYGGSVNDVAIDPDRSVYLTGVADSQIALVNAIQDAPDSNDAFVAKIEPSGAAFAYSTPLGGPGYDAGAAIAVDEGGNAWLAGQTSGDFPIVGDAFQPASGPFSRDAFVAKIGKADNVLFGQSQVFVSEPDGQVEIGILRSDAAPDVPVTVVYTTTSGSATSFFDYTPTSGTVSFAPGETRHSVTIPIHDDDLVEGEETFELSLGIQDPSNGVVVGHRSTATVRIQDTDYPPPIGTATQGFVVRDRVRATGPSWEASADVPWLRLEPTSGTGPSPVAVTADSAGLAPGAYSGTITVTAVAQDSPQRIQVTLEVGTHFTTVPESLRLRADDPAATGQITLAAGGGSGGDGGPAAEASLTNPTAVAVDGAGNVYIADPDAFRVRRVSPDGRITTFAGNGTQGYSGDGGPATEAQIDDVNGIATDGSGNVFISDTSRHRVRKIGVDGIITRVAGTGNAGFAGDGGEALQADLNAPVGLAVDGSGNLLIADAANNRIRSVDALGNITTVAGNGTGGWSGDGGPATAAMLNFPVAVAVDAASTLYIAETGNHLVRKVAGGTISTFAGGTIECEGLSIGPGFGGDRMPAYGSALDQPRGLAVNARGEVFIADSQNHRIRKVVGGGIYTVAGNGMAGYSGDGGAGAGAQLDGPWAVATDGAGGVFIADTGNQRVRRVGGQATQVAAPFDVFGTDGWTLGDWQATSDVPWLSVMPAQGIGDMLGVGAVVDLTALAAGVHDGTITLNTDQGIVQRTLAVSVTVPPPGLSVEPTVLRLFGDQDFVSVLSGTLHIFDSVDAGGPLSWQLSADVPWISFSQDSGTGPTTVTVNADVFGFSEEVGAATITLTAEGADTPRMIQVVVTVDRCGGS